MSSLPPVLANHAARHIRNAIFTGALAPGQRLDPEALSQEIGVSRQPVREALILLATEGLVERRPRRVAVVAQLTREDVLDHYASFGMLSGLAAERAAHLLTSQDFDSMRKANERLSSASSVQEQALQNFIFHATINRVGGSRRLLSLIKLLHRSIPDQFFDANPAWASQALSDHQGILAALQARDPEAARDAMYKHLVRAGHQSIAVLEAASFWDSTSRT